MVVVYAFGLAAVAVCAVAASRVLLYPNHRGLPENTFLREAETASAPAFDAGAINTELASPADLELAAALINSQQISVIKRFSDIVLSLALLAVTLPMLALTAIAIRLDSRGPILYRQRRVGFKGLEFEVFKFRSMIVDAEPDGPRYAATKDDRITRVGAIIRKFRVDEIPQAINVLRGEMSFVGPRPERPEFVRDLEQEIPLYHCRHLVKPGITGWAQVKYEYAASVEGARNKLRYDLYYIRHFSPLLDLLIVLMTVRVALFGIGSR
ncbi:exopolysaccharide biosynthesis polyprenyl glycosylphosphotransferase [Hyphococcus flavus]|uniref:Exopolysaccharide biosynthesis polyprenyl glycosylphosphotransferase n=1 Tax=Hyphococcus flavus TaxID=1866326 RepID=A0AAE9ZC46_9PROT|nr:exopolysaccharide biosynthesis polyprenyl glycosylphosphotransferase [Hyphococcus flavus]WDI32004.1 exopolysaccharide biosynthesis polyprenyl glycosylphosphotransferase [Hyphococcus flavus]